MDSGKECRLPMEEEFLQPAGRKEERNFQSLPNLKLNDSEQSVYQIKGATRAPFFVFYGF
jgi:hypothetical protein